MHFRHPTDEQLRHVDIYFLATKIICSLFTLNSIFLFYSILFCSVNYLNESTNQNDGLADARTFSRPTSKARENRPGDEVGKISLYLLNLGAPPVSQERERREKSTEFFKLKQCIKTALKS